MLSGSSVIRKYIAWYAVRIPFHKELHSSVPDFVSDFVHVFIHGFVGVLEGVSECVSAHPGNILQILAPQAKMTSTASTPSTASKFCARSRSECSMCFPTWNLGEFLEI